MRGSPSNEWDRTHMAKGGYRPGGGRPRKTSLPAKLAPPEPPAEAADDAAAPGDRQSLVTPEWSTACPDWERRLLAGQSLIPFGPLYEGEAKAAAEIFRDLPIVDAAGSPTMGQACKPWVFDFCDAVFGSYNHETGRRLIREFFLLVAKKNAKSTTAAGMMLTALLRNWRKSGEYLIIAPTLEIAQNSFKPAHDMIMED